MIQSTIRALVETFLEELPGADVNEAVAFIQRQRGRLPDFLKLPLTTLTLMFALWPLRKLRRPFSYLSPDERRRQIDNWKNSSLAFRRDLMKFYESLSVFSVSGETRTEPRRA